MAQPFDITLKHLLEAHPADCLRLVGLPTTAPVEVIDADLATVIAEADKVFRVKDPHPWLMHFELQASYDADLPERMLRYNVLLKHRHGLPVRSVVILLRAKADGPEMGGVVRHSLDGEQYLEFRYRVVRIWQKPVSDILAGGVGTLPLAPLAAVGKPDLPAVIRRMKERLSAEAPRHEEAVLWTATYVLMGLRYDQALAGELLKGVLAMEESVTYQEIIRKGEAKGKAEGKAEGEVEEAKRILLRFGVRAFGAPDATTKAAIDALADRERLEALIDRVDEVKNWKELLAKPRSQRRNGKKQK
jgi:predicted transposase YdaD